MCGICGAYNRKTSRPIDGARLRAANAALSHRGPDDEGFLEAGSFAFAMRRLSIIDLDTGRQPIANEDRTVWTVFNGEIYNYVELRRDLEARGHRFATRTDTETIVHLYEEHGEDFVGLLNGMFALAVWDAKSKTLLLARDRAGIKPLYYAETPDGLAFASELRALHKLGVSWELDPEALAEYLGSGYMLAPRTGLRGVRKLSPGCILTCGPSGVRETRYWRWSERREPPRSETEAQEEFRALFKRVLERQTRSDVPVGLFMSGGTDSRLIGASLARELGRPLGAISVGFEDPAFDELPAVRRSCEALGIPLEAVTLSESELLAEVPKVLDAVDEPLMDYSAVPTYALCRAARRRFKVVLAGDGGDELFGGYPTHRLEGPASVYRLLPGALRRALAAVADKLPAGHGYLSLDERLKRFASAAGLPPGAAHPRYKALLLEDAQSAVWNGGAPLKPFAGFEHFYGEAASLGLKGAERLLYVDFKTFLPEDCLAKSDRMSMACALEARVPLLDNEVIDFAARLPAAWRVGGSTLKPFLKRALARYLPKKEVYTSKRGFTPPMARWINGPLAPLVDDLLSPERVRRQGLFRPEAVSALLREHRERRHERSRALWALAVLSQWLDRRSSVEAAS